MIDCEELLKQKERVDHLSSEEKKTCEALQGLCKEILYAEDIYLKKIPKLNVDRLSEILLFQVSKKVNDHLRRTTLLLDAYEEYSEMIERSYDPGFRILWAKSLY